MVAISQMCIATRRFALLLKVYTETGRSSVQSL